MPPMASAANILVFDSGLGGLTVFREAVKTRPDARFVYAADDAFFPYGRQEERRLVARVLDVMGKLIAAHRSDLVVIACNTASTIALAGVRAALDLPVVGTVPAIKPAAEASLTRAIGVLGTDATVRQAYVDNLAAQFAADCLVLRHGSADLVAATEAKLRGEPIDPARYAAALAGLLDQPGGARIDTVVLACTHFPLVQAELAAAAPRPLAFVDGSAGIAQRIAHLTQGQAWPDARPDGIAVFTRLGAPEAALAPALARHGLTRIEAL